MMFLIFIATWLILLVMFTLSKGWSEGNPLVKLLGGLCVVIILLTALYTMFTVNIMVGLGMFGSLAILEVRDEEKKTPVIKTREAAGVA